jgi:retron-type reverse transcriptase
VVAADIKGVFDHRDPDWRLERRRVRLEDRAVLGLIRTWRNAGMLETAGRVIHPATGTPPGGVVAPVLAQGS